MITTRWSTARAVRSASTLADRLARAVDVTGTASPEMDKVRQESELDESGEQFRELFIKPKRKLMSQLTIERMTGRAEQIKFSKGDVFDRMAVRGPRKEEMKVDQDWPSVWPAARSFRSSVVPLPVRMGYSKVRNGAMIRPPFKTEGNLELVKIPNFLHLTPEHIKRHCAEIKKFCTKFPEELKDEELVRKHFPITYKYSDFVHQGTSLRDIRARVVTQSVRLADLGLEAAGRDKFRRLVRLRYDEAADTFTLVTDRCYTRKQNREYAEYLLTVLYHESKKTEDWEKLKERLDSWKLEFEGSPGEQRVKHIPGLSKDGTAGAPDSEQLLRQFAGTWEKYRNSKETPESARRYGQSVRQLLGLPKLLPEARNLVEHKSGAAGQS